MASKKQGTLLSAVIAVITVVGVGSYDFSNQSTNIDNSEETNISGGENIFQEFTNMASKEIAEEAGLIFICTQDEIPETHTQKCEDWNNP